MRAKPEPIWVEVMANVVAHVRREIEDVRREAFANYNVVRVEMGLQPAKPRVRAKAGTGRSW